jgi:hypothetical protein
MKSIKRYVYLLAVILPALAIILSGSQVPGASAQSSLPPDRSDVLAPDDFSNYIPVQGRLTDSGGNPLTGDYTLTFRIYNVSSGGTALCQHTAGTYVNNGLFSTYMNASACSDDINGQQLYLGVEVGTDGEMTPRAYIDNVPYAWSLRPGAYIEAEINDDPILTLYNTGSGEGLWATSVTGEGVHGASGNGAGVAAYSLLGPALYAESLNGPALVAGGTGIITSSAESFLWISGSDIVPWHMNDTTFIFMDSNGGAYVERGADAGVKYVALPVTIPGVLYGQNAKITEIAIYFSAETEFDGITDVRVRRQVGTCPSCYVDILHDSADHGCEFDLPGNEEGCILTYDLTTNNVLSETSGVLHIGLGFNFGGVDTYVQVGGVRLTIEYDD